MESNVELLKVYALLAQEIQTAERPVETTLPPCCRVSESHSLER